MAGAVVTEDQHIISIVFNGVGVTPKTLDASLSLDVVVNYIRALKATASFEWQTKDAPFIPTFVGVSSGSVNYALAYAVTEGAAPHQAEECWRVSHDRVHACAMDPSRTDSRLRHRFVNLKNSLVMLPVNVNASVKGHGREWSMTEVANQKPAPFSKGTSSFRAKIIRVGGIKRPRVQLSYRGDTMTLSVDANHDTASKAGKLLYKDVDVTVTIVRALQPPLYPVVSGKLIDIRELSGEDTIIAFDKWYNDIGRPLQQRDDDELVEHG